MADPIGGRHQHFTFDVPCSAGALDDRAGIRSHGLRADHADNRQFVAPRIAVDPAAVVDKRLVALKIGKGCAVIGTSTPAAACTNDDTGGQYRKLGLRLTARFPSPHVPPCCRVFGPS